MTRADFEERAAILEYDGGLSRADAESAGLCANYTPSGMAAELPGILGELVHADRYGFNPDLAPVIRPSWLRNVRGPAYGA